MKRQNQTRRRQTREGVPGVLLLLAVVAALALGGCQNTSPKVRVENYRPGPGGTLGRIEIAASELEVGLTELFERLEEQYGPYAYGPVIKDYLPAFQEGLYYHGYAVVERLNVNGASIHILASFRVDRQPAVLRIEAYQDGVERPVVVLDNAYYVRLDEAETTAATGGQSPMGTRGQEVRPEFTMRTATSGELGQSGRRDR